MGSTYWVDRFFARHLVLIYYWVNVVYYWLSLGPLTTSPTK